MEKESWVVKVEVACWTMPELCWKTKLVVGVTLTPIRWSRDAAQTLSPQPPPSYFPPPEEVAHWSHLVEKAKGLDCNLVYTNINQSSVYAIYIAQGIASHCSHWGATECFSLRSHERGPQVIGEKTVPINWKIRIWLCFDYVIKAAILICS